MEKAVVQLYMKNGMDRIELIIVFGMHLKTIDIKEACGIDVKNAELLLTVSLVRSCRDDPHVR